MNFNFLTLPKKKLENDKQIIIPITIGKLELLHAKIILKRIHEQLFEKRIIDYTHLIEVVISCKKCSKIITDNQLYLIENEYFEGANFLCAKCHEANYILDDII